MYETYETQEMTAIQIKRFTDAFDREIGTECEVGSTTPTRWYAVCSELTPREVKRVRQIENRILTKNFSVTECGCGECRNCRVYDLEQNCSPGARRGEWLKTDHVDPRDGVRRLWVDVKTGRTDLSYNIVDREMGLIC